MFRSSLSRFIGILIALCFTLTLFSQPQPASAFFAQITDYNELVTAINQANANGGGVIAFEPSFMPYNIELDTTLPTITGDITILGNENILLGGAMFVTDPAFRAFHIAQGASLTLNNLLITDFLIEGGDGGVILNEGDLFLSNVLFAGNGIDLTSPLRGGIIYNTGYVYAKNSLIGYSLLGTLLLHQDKGHQLFGTAIYNTGTMELENTSISLSIGIMEDPDSSATVYNAGQLTFNNVSLWANVVLEIDLNNPNFDETAIINLLNSETVGGLHSIAGSQTNINNSVIALNFLHNCQFDAGANVSVSNSYTVELKDYFDIDDFDPDELPVDPDELPVDPDDITGLTMADIPDTACDNLIPMQNLDITIAGPNGIMIIPDAESINGADNNAMPYDLLGLARNGSPDAGAFEYIEDENGDPIVDLDYPYVYFTAPSDTVLEDVGTAQIEIAIDFCDSGCEPFSGIFDIYILDERTGTATADDDYVAFPYFNTTTVTVDCTAGCPATINLPVDIVHDLITPEGDETINLRIIGTSGYGIIDLADQLEFELTIQDVAPYPVSVSATQPNAHIAPLTNGQFTFDVGFIPPVDITLSYSISGTANPNEGYTALSGSITVPAGSQTATLDVAPLGDSSIPSGQTVIVALTASSYTGHLLDPSPATVTITRPDPTAVPTGTVTPNPTINPTINPPITPEPTAQPTGTGEYPDGQSPDISIFDPAISKIGLLLPGDLGLSGERLEWVTTVSNRGNASGYNIVITDILRPELQINSVSVPNGSYVINGQTVTVTYPEIPAGAVYTFSIFTTVLNSNVEIDNTVCLTGGGANICATGYPTSNLPATGERPVWADLLARWFGW